VKLLMCTKCFDVVRMHSEPRSCRCGAATGHYLDNEIVEQTAGSVSIALHNHDLRTALEAYAAAPSAWHPLFVFRAYINPTTEPDVRFVEPPAPEPT
jgi:hypothetical protein